MQNNRFERGPLLNKDGLLNDVGYDFSRSKEYVRNDIKAKEIRIKEEDVYTIMNDKFVFKIKLINLTNHKLIIINFNDFLSNEKLEKIIRINKNEQFILPASSLIGVIKYNAKGISLNVETANTKASLKLNVSDFMEKPLRADIYLSRIHPNTMTNIYPFSQRKKLFLYEEKINLIKTNGYLKLGNKYYEFTPTSYCSFRSSRGALPHFFTHYQASMNGVIKGHNFALSLGYGITSEADNENVLFYDDEAYKLTDVRFTIPINKNGKYDYLKEWNIASSDGSISIIFKPFSHNETRFKKLFTNLKENITYGEFKGYVTIEDKTIEFNEIVGYALKSYYKW